MNIDKRNELASSSLYINYIRMISIVSKETSTNIRAYCSSAVFSGWKVSESWQLPSEFDKKFRDKPAPLFWERAWSFFLLLIFLFWNVNTVRLHTDGVGPEQTVNTWPAVETSIWHFDLTLNVTLVLHVNWLKTHFWRDFFFNIWEIKVVGQRGWGIVH